MDTETEGKEKGSRLTPLEPCVLGGGRLLPVPVWKSVWVGDGRAGWRQGPNCSVGDHGVGRTEARGKTPK